jgi:hypothetical protein
MNGAFSLTKRLPEVQGRTRKGCTALINFVARDGKASDRPNVGVGILLINYEYFS